VFVCLDLKPYQVRTMFTRLDLKPYQVRTMFARLDLKPYQVRTMFVVAIMPLSSVGVGCNQVEGREQSVCRGRAVCRSKWQ
jgi:hypothetical protein